MFDKKKSLFPGDFKKCYFKNIKDRFVSIIVIIGLLIAFKFGSQILKCVLKLQSINKYIILFKNYRKTLRISKHEMSKD